MKTVCLMVLIVALAGTGSCVRTGKKEAGGKHGENGNGKNAGAVEGGPGGEPLDAHGSLMVEGPTQDLSGVKAIATGRDFTCSLLRSGDVMCWGENDTGQLGNGKIADQSVAVKVKGLSGAVTAISSGYHHACALLDTGEVRCWGENSDGQLGSGIMTDKAVLTPLEVKGLHSAATAVSAGGFHTCALLDTGGVQCWGYNNDGQVGDGTLESKAGPVDVKGLDSGVVAISSGGYHACALLDTGEVRCWGWNSNGQLGDGTRKDSTAPVDIAELPPGIVSIACGYQHTCALTGMGAIRCWGNNFYGQLGDGKTADSWAPVAVTGLPSGVKAINSGAWHTCALLDTGDIKCWGNNLYGQLGDGTMDDEWKPVSVKGLSSPATAVATGGLHTCSVLDTGEVQCWGWNNHGQLGDGTITGHKPVPVETAGLSSGVTAVVSGFRHSCAITDTGGLLCWGDNSKGQIGDGTTTDRFMPVKVVGLSSDVVAVSAGGQHTCAVLSGGGVKCWGSSKYGQLGDGTKMMKIKPVSVKNLESGVIAVAAGFRHTCALLTGGEVRCWGYNGEGQVGDETKKNKVVPVNVKGLRSGVKALAAGVWHTCAVMSDGGVKCWGNNFYGQLGDGTKNNRRKPVDVKELHSGVAAIFPGGYHTCALLGAGGVKCWGWNYYGELGDGSTSHKFLPVDVSGLDSSAASVCAGGYHTCAALGSGDVKCWGENFYGQIGDGTMKHKTTGVDVKGLSSGIKSVSCGSDHTCALSDAGKVLCWGWNAYGQLGDGALVINTSPVSVRSYSPR
jgi:alpha-tubulin suppressor-like RCC1 family protein